MARKGGLGKGLDILIPQGVLKEDTQKEKEQVKVSPEKENGDFMVKISMVEPNKEQPRKSFDEAALNEAGALLQDGAKSLCDGDKCDELSLHVTHDTQTLQISSTPEGLAMPASTQAVQGGMVFSLQLAPLARAVERTPVAETNPAMLESLQVGAAIVERVDGAATTRNGMMHTLLRVQPAGN